MDEALKVANDELALAVNKLWEDRTHADLTIICHPRQWKVHKAILCSRSDFFKAACQPGRFKEGRENVITLPSRTDDPHPLDIGQEGDDDPDAINVLIYHLYHPNTDYTTLAGDAGMEFVLHARVFAAAEKYNLKGLKLQAVHHARSLLKKASKNEGIQLQMAEAMRAVYEGTAETVGELRQCVGSALLQNQGKLLQVPTIRQAIESVPGLTYDLLQMKTLNTWATGSPACGLWRDKTHADLTVQCYPRQWRVHKAILCSRCGFFKAACEPGRFKEGSENTITLRSRLESEDSDDDNDDAAGCDDPEAINVLMYHLYHPSAKYRDLDANGKGMTLILHVRVFAAADKYGLKALQLQASDFAHEIMNQRDPNSELQDQMTEALKPIYTETPATAISLRRSMNSVLWRNRGELLKSPPFQAAIEAVPGLAYELLLTKANDDFDRTMPPYCGCSDIDNSIFKCQDCGARKQLCKRHEREWNAGDDFCDMCDTGETKRLLHAWK
ncbi:hypothetical protein KC315_g10044 [Hortaea werneckii]|nr:hypothetical protein KC342_g6630 [Hortaea werneckii]KAI7099546.1 hypothetical protein KC339_g8116 [Hortaea werneckii]KAI7240739.1 hypothetical protein KC365_g3706 [Hortaea werneckii]KAI7288415.1 hypothetical protein KC340_g17980 [Hortaea werneckii]KAI7318419.1 hypothetical protein KC315_g10044 [Hortaea werneckii]